MSGISAWRDFFMWCTIFNLVIYLFSFLATALARERVYRQHKRLFQVSRENFNLVVYFFFALYKLLIVLFNLVPWIAFSILTL